MVTLAKLGQAKNAFRPMLRPEERVRLVNSVVVKALLLMLVTPAGSVSGPVGAMIYPVTAMLVPELLKVRKSGIQTAYRVTLAVPIGNEAPDA
jgi:hypothetical protein